MFRVRRLRTSHHERKGENERAHTSSAARSPSSLMNNGHTTQSERPVSPSSSEMVIDELQRQLSQSQSESRSWKLQALSGQSHGTGSPSAIRTNLSDKNDTSSCRSDSNRNRAQVHLAVSQRLVNMKRVQTELMSGVEAVVRDLERRINNHETTREHRTSSPSTISFDTKRSSEERAKDLVRRLRSAVSLIASDECVSDLLANRVPDTRWSDMEADLRRTKNELWMKDNEIIRLNRQIESLEAEVDEAKQVAGVHDSLILASSSLTSSISQEHEPLETHSKTADEPSVVSVREKIRKKRESERRLLEKLRICRDDDSNSSFYDCASSLNNPPDFEADSGSISSDSIVAETRPSSYKREYDECKCENDLPQGFESLDIPLDPTLLIMNQSDERQSQDFLQREMTGGPRSPLAVKCGHENDKLSCDCSEMTAPSSDYSTIDCPSTSSRRSPGLVNFNTVKIRTYSCTLGDNPSVTCGAPIALDWKYGDEVEMSVDYFEATKKFISTRPDDLFLTSIERRCILRKCGFTDGEIDAASLSNQHADEPTIPIG